LGSTSLHSSGASVVSDALRVVVVDDRLVVHIVNVGYIHVVDSSVVVKLSTFPASAIVSIAGIAVAIVNTAIEPDGSAPISRMPVIDSGGKAPESRCPEESNLRRHDPRTGNPVVVIDVRAPCPIARNPDVSRSWTQRLGIDGQDGRSE
jgi:hypothetical protein